MKKRFFTFLMAVWALLSISQTVKAADDVYLLSAEQINDVKGNYQDTNTDHPMELESGDTYKIKIESNSSDAVFTFEYVLAAGALISFTLHRMVTLLTLMRRGAQI